MSGDEDFGQVRRDVVKMECLIELREIRGEGSRLAVPTEPLIYLRLALPTISRVVHYWLNIGNNLAVHHDLINCRALLHRPKSLHDSKQSFQNVVNDTPEAQASVRTISMSNYAHLSHQIWAERFFLEATQESFLQLPRKTGPESQSIMQ